jgi:Zn-dependent peptidase ImmA (M78 family)
MANKANTVAKGNAFEDRVYSKFKELLESENLGLDSKRSYVHHKKSYKGRSGSNIIFDISIETYMPNAKEYSYLTIIECKDYNNPIQVEKIRDFSYCIKDVGGHKGYFITTTTSKFQRGVLNIARQEGVGLAIMDNSDNIDWKIRRIGKRHYQIRNDIEEYISDVESTNKYPFIAISGYNYYTSVIDFLSDVVEQELNLSIKIPFIKPEEIEKQMSDIFKQKNRDDSPYYMSTNELIDFAKNQLKINIDFDNELNDELGCCDFQKNKISVAKSMEYDSHRWRFTFAHEIGHYILHHYLYENYNIFMADDDESNFIIDGLGNNLSKRIEIQANMFASKLLVPDKPLTIGYFQLHKELALRNFPNLYVDYQRENIHNYNYITKVLSKNFGVSQEVIKYKLLGLKFLTIDHHNTII